MGQMLLVARFTENDNPVRVILKFEICNLKFLIWKLAYI